MTVTFDAVHAYHTATNGNLTLEKTSSVVAWSASRSTTTKSSGKWYWEIKIDVMNAGSNTILGAAVDDVTQYPGISATSWGYNGSGGEKHNNGNSSAYGNTYTTNDIIGIALDLDNGKIFFAKNNVWQASGNPATGANPAYTGISGSIKPVVGMYAKYNKCTGRFLAAAQSYTPPAGFSAFEAAPVISYLYTTVDQPYAMHSGDILATIVEQPYSFSILIGISVEQFYSMVMEIWHTQIYGDTPQLNTSLTQGYRSAQVLNTTLHQPWEDALALQVNLEQSWLMPDMMETYSEHRYGIVAEVLNLTSEQLYHINELSTLFAGLSQPYAIAGEAAMIYRFDTKLYIDGLRMPYHSLEWQQSEDEYVWSCEFVIKGMENAVRCVEGAEIRIDSAGESWWLKCVGGWRLDKRFASEVYRISGYSKTRALSEGPTLLGDIPGGLASQMVADIALPYDITVDWQMADGYIQDGTVVANNESALDVIRKIVADAKGRVLSTPEGNLLIVCREEVAVPDWPTVAPAETIVARLERVSTSEQPDTQPGYNRFIVSDQLASGKTHNLVKEMLDGNTAELRLYVTPIDDAPGFVLSHSLDNPAAVGIEPFGIVSAEIAAELVEITAGSGRTANPIYAITSRTWSEKNLGYINFSEDGLLKTEIAQYSLVRLTYVTKYYRWIARHPSIADVQFRADEVIT